MGRVVRSRLTVLTNCWCFSLFGPHRDLGHNLSTSYEYIILSL